MPEDESYLNKRGLTHFWENIDDIKQNKLIAGAGILITNDVISATGGGTADAVDWGHITGLMSNQADLTAALAAKANSADLATVATSGDYDDLTDKPTIGNATLTIQKNGTSAGTFTANATSNETINITVPTTAADVSALPASTKYGASIAVSIDTTDYKVTTTLKDQDGNTLGTAQVIDLPLESVVVNGSYDSTNKKIILTLQNGSTIDIPVADLVAGLQSEITSTNKLASDLVDDTNQTNKFMTSAEKTKLSGIEAGAEVNVQSDWNQTTTTADDYIKNKPSIPTKTSDLTNDSNFVSDANYVHTDNNYTTAEKDKLSGIAAGAEVNVQSDWNQTTATADDYIKNKPTLAAVATSGSYNDLSNKPTIPTVNDATLTIQKNGSTVNTFTANASSNVTANITVPVNTSDLNNDSGFITATDYADASTGGVVKVGSGLSIDSSGVLSATASGPQRYDATWTTTQQVATQTQYDELRAAILAGDIIYARENNEEIIATRYGAPTGSVFVYFSFDELYEDHGNVSTTVAAFAVSVDGTTKAITTLADTVAIPESVPTKTSDLTNDGDDGVHPFVSTDDLATVATSGSYNDLSNKPTIPTVNDATLTITQNGTSAGTFTANASSNTTIALTDTTYSNFTGATSSVAGAAGLVPAPTTSDPDKYLKGDGTWATPAGGEMFDVTISTATGATWTSDKTYAQIVAAIAAGTPFNVRVDFPPMFTAAVNSVHYSPNDGEVYFGMSFDPGSGMITETITIDSSNNITATQDALPAVNNGMLTITQGGSTLGTFTANASSNVTIDVPGGSSTITGTGAPTSSTAAEVGQFYLDTQTGNTYVCTDDTGGTYTWDTVGGGVSLTMTTTDPGEGSALAANTILGVYDGGGVTMDYSTAEQATGYTWINGNMIYKKTVNFGALPNSTAKTVAHSITSLGKIIKLEGYGRKTNGATYPLPYASAGSGSIELYADNTNIEITTTNDRTDISECYVTLYYTKGA